MTTRLRAWLPGRVDPANYDPPAPWVRFYVALHPPQGRRTQRSLAGLSDAELAWVGRAVAAELQRRARKET